MKKIIINQQANLRLELELTRECVRLNFQYLQNNRHNLVFSRLSQPLFSMEITSEIKAVKRILCH